jgi:hypothetical protein
VERWNSTVFQRARPKFDENILNLELFRSDRSVRSPTKCNMEGLYPTSLSNQTANHWQAWLERPSKSSTMTQEAKG